ncbi:MAG: hypothetical protein L3J22_07195 [Xanthomonadales bacterium]|nr:hypothetical protein [Xanthomonadales bacterium]
MKRFIPFEGGNADELLAQLAPEDRLIPYQVSWADDEVTAPVTNRLVNPDAAPAGRRVQAATVLPGRR